MNNVIKPKFDPVTDFQDRWITSGIDPDGLNYLENFGYFLCDKKNINDRYPGYAAVTVSQIRNVFGEIKRIVSTVSNQETEVSKDIRMEFLLLRPKIAYNAARVIAKSRNSRIEHFKIVLEKAHHSVDASKPKHIQNFASFVEGIVAYHKVYGGKE